VRVGGELSIGIDVARTGTAGDVVVTAVVPAGVTADPLTIADGSDHGELVLHADAAAPVARDIVAITAAIGPTTGNASVDLDILGASGTLDPTFGTAGQVVFAGSPKIETPEILVGQGERVVVGIGLVRDGHDGILVVRFARDGTQDPTFGTAGEAFLDVTTIGLTSHGRATAAVQPDGAIVIAGSGSNGSNNNPYVVRLTADGQIDSALSMRRLDTSTADLGVEAVAIGPGGEIVFAGRKNTTSGSTTTSDGMLMRTDANGARDVNFGFAFQGIVTFNDLAFDEFTHLAIQSDGRIVVVV
jgi:uncharacterized delta-60 repeat protein